MTTLLEVRALETFYGRSQALFGIDFEVRQGEVVGLMGRNGMGKTTTIRSIMGLTRSQRGQVLIGGAELQSQPTYEIARAGVAIVPEGRQVFRDLSVREHLLMVRTPRQHSGTKAWTLERVYELFPRLLERENNLGTQLSGGEQQMLAIGRALMTNPRLVLFDEATEGLAPLIRAEIWSAIRILKSQGISILLVDKNLPDVAALAERMLVMEKGRIVWSGASHVLCGDPQLQHRYLGV